MIEYEVLLAMVPVQEGRFGISWYVLISRLSQILSFI
jgi:hypothetical protein